jgi:Fructose-2,6-bisphosphatase
LDLYIFRHGETDWNRERRLQGHTDIPLNQTGVDQAHKLAELIAPFKPQVIFTSDLSRARETAKIVNKVLKVPLYENKGLRECHVGIAEGMLRDDVTKLHGDNFWDRWVSVAPEDVHFAFPSGEKKSDHLKRMISCIEEFCRQHPQYERIAISTHGGSLRRVVHHCENAPAEAVALPNCVLYKLSFDVDTRTWQYHQLIAASE